MSNEKTKSLDIGVLKKITFNNEEYKVELQFYNRFDYSDFLKDFTKDVDWRIVNNLFLSREDEKVIES